MQIKHQIYTKWRKMNTKNKLLMQSRHLTKRLPAKVTDKIFNKVKADGKKIKK